MTFPFVSSQEFNGSIIHARCFLETLDDRFPLKHVQYQTLQDVEVIFFTWVLGLRNI